jgi:GNAT superfamily N-acetyltransferase
VTDAPHQDPRIRTATPSDAAWIAARHAELYARDEGFDDTFGPLVAEVLADFFAVHEADCERGWVAVADRPLGSIFCVRLDDRTANLRLFLVEPAARGRGLGRQLLATCTDFARRTGYRRMTLWTHETHRAACRLYAADGFVCTDSRPVRSFGQDLVEQTWSRDL